MLVIRLCWCRQTRYHVTVWLLIRFVPDSVMPDFRWISPRLALVGAVGAALLVALVVYGLGGAGPGGLGGPGGMMGGPPPPSVLVGHAQLGPVVHEISAIGSLRSNESW